MIPRIVAFDTLDILPDHIFRHRRLPGRVPHIPHDDIRPAGHLFPEPGLSFSLKDLAATLIKSLIFGVLIPLISCYYGMMPRSKFEIPIFVSRAVSRTLFAIIILNVVVSVSFYFTWLE